MAKKLKLINSEQKAIVDNEDYQWASKHDWRLHTDGHVVRDGKAAEPKIVYLCNEVMSRHNNVPLELYRAPASAVRH